MKPKTKPWLNAAFLLTLLAGCYDASGNAPSGQGGAGGTGGTTATGGSASGGTTATGGSSATGGTTSNGGSSATGGSSASGGNTSSGGSSATGGSSASGGSSANGGRSGTGGRTGTGGAATGGSGDTGGATGTGGSTRTGGSSGTGGGPATGGSSGGGGTGVGGRTGSGGAGGNDGGLRDGGARDGGREAGNDTGSTTFDPCPASEACKILPLGDSITDGIGFSGGYRVQLFAKAVADGKNITFVGGSANGPTTVSGKTFPRAHEGHSGWTISQIDGIVPDPALNPGPHIILLHIGTNDMAREPGGAPDRLATLVDQIVADLPNSLLVVSSIIPLPSAASAVTTFNAAVPGIVQQRASAGKHVLFADQFKGFPTSELGDGVHPNEAGYARMAGVWYESIKAYLH